MISLAPYRYRNVLSVDGGPIKALELHEMPTESDRSFQANAWLQTDLVSNRRTLAIYSDADGSGTHASPLIARFMAISECLERWAYYACVDSADAERHGFQTDPTSNGMAAFPGVTRSGARQRAFLEAIERASLFGWWEGNLNGAPVTTQWPEVSAVAICNPLSADVTVITYQECQPGLYAYGHAAGHDLPSAIARAKIEMDRCAIVLMHYQLTLTSGQSAPADDRFEKRLAYFSSPAGHQHFLARVKDRASATGCRWKISHDLEIRGPWSRFTTVWRVVIPPRSHAFIHTDEPYFFW